MYKIALRSSYNKSLSVFISKVPYCVLPVNMDSHFLDDCGLEGDDHLCNELDQVRKEYFAAVSDRNGDQLDLSDSSDSEVSDDVSFDETLVPSTTASGTQRNNEDTIPDQSSADISGDFVTPVKLFLEGGCDCRYGKNQSSCTKSLCLEELVEHRMQCIELTSAELDLVVLGVLQSHMNLSSGKKRHWMSYFFRGVQVCKKTFLLVYCIGKSQLENSDPPEEGWSSSKETH